MEHLHTWWDVVAAEFLDAHQAGRDTMATAAELSRVSAEINAAADATPTAFPTAGAAERVQ